MNVEYKFKEFGFEKFSGFIVDLISKYELGEIRFQLVEGISISESQLNHLGNVSDPNSFLYVWNINVDKMRVVKFELFKKEGGLPKIEMTFDLDNKTIFLNETQDISSDKIKESLKMFFEIELTYEELSTENIKLQNEIVQLMESFEKEKGNLLNLHKQEKEGVENEWKEKSETQKNELEEKIKKNTEEINNLNGQNIQKDSEISTLKEDIQNKQNELTARDLKKIAVAFEKQEDIYAKSVEKWLFGAFSVFALAFLYTFFVVMVLNKDVFTLNSIKYYSLDIIFALLVYFCIIQYSYHTKLKDNYALRKTLAQSYHNIIESSEDVDIKNNFLSKTADVLCCGINANSKNDLSGHAMSDILEIAKNLSKKM